MTHAKYIKRGGKTYGPYFYKSVREKDGRVTKIYLGTSLKEDKNNYLWLVFGFIAIFSVLLLIFGLKFAGFSIYSTNNITLEVNQLVSKDSFILVNEAAQPIPLELTDINGSFYYNITTLSFNFDNGQYNVSVMDNGTAVFSETVDVDTDSGYEQEVITNAAVNTTVNNTQINETVIQNGSVVQDINTINTTPENITIEQNVSAASADQVSAQVTNQNIPLIIEEEIGYDEAEINKPVVWTKKVKANKNVNSLSVKIDSKASNIKVYNVKKDKKSEIKNFKQKSNVNNNAVTGNVVLVKSNNIIAKFFNKVINFAVNFFANIFSVTGLAVSDSSEINIDISNTGDEFEITYELPGPSAVEKVISNTTKQLIITSEIEYKNVKSYIDIDDTFYDNINLYHIMSYNEKIDYPKVEDRNNNGMFDRVVWYTPHLSTQTYEVNIKPFNNTERIIIILKDNVRIDDFLNTVGEGFKLGYRYGIFNGVSAVVSSNELLNLKSNPSIKGIYQDFDVSVDLQDSVSLINATLANAVRVNNVNITGKGQTICVVDTGVDRGHPALVNKVKAEYCFCSSCCADGSNEMSGNATDDNGHGTHVSGIAAGNSTIIGVAPDAGIVAAKVCNSAGSCATADMIKGMEFCVSNRSLYNISAITMSLGGSTLYTDVSTCEAVSAGFLAAVTNATINNIVFDASAGNSYDKSGITWPACVGDAIAVGSTTKTDLVSSFSNRGGLLDVWAPGSSINSSVPVGSCSMCAASRYGVASGTSMAAPHVAGAAALLQQYYKEKNNLNLTPADVLYLLQAGGKPLADNQYGSDSQLTFSRINPYDSINLIMTVNSTTNTTGNTFGNITFSDPNNLSNINKCVNISKNFISVNSALCPQFNKSAKIVLNTFNFNSTPIVLRDGSVCSNTICNIFNYANNNLTFNVTQFSNYSATANSNLSIWTEVDSGFMYGGLTRYIGDQVYIFANYTNTTNNSLISIGSCNISFSDANGNFVINTTKNLFEYNRTFSLSVINNYTVNCNVTTYENLTKTASFAVNPFEATVCNSGCGYSNLTFALISNNNTENATITLNQGNATYNITSIAIYNISARGSFPAIKFNSSDQALDCSRSGIINYNNNSFGLYAVNKSNITIINCNITGYYLGMDFLSSISINLTNNYINNSGAHGINLTSTNASVNLNTINNSGGYALYLLNSNNTPSLATLNSGNTLASATLGKLIVNWYAQIRVINNTKNVSSATVNITEFGRSAAQYNLTTNATGLTDIVIITQYLIENNGTQTNKTDHRIVATKSLGGTQDLIFALTGSRTLANEIKLNLSNCVVPNNNPPIAYSADTTLCAGTYYLGLGLLEGDIIINLNAENITLKCDGTNLQHLLIAEYDYMVVVTKKNVTVKDCYIEGSAVGLYTSLDYTRFINNTLVYNEIQVESSADNVSIINNTITGETGDGIDVGLASVGVSSNIWIEGNNISNMTGKGMYLYVANSTIIRNNISNVSSYAIWLPITAGVMNNTIANNTIHGSIRDGTEGVSVTYSIGNSTFINNFINGTLWNDHAVTLAANNISFINNIIYGNVSIAGGYVVNNTIHNGPLIIGNGVPSIVTNNTINGSSNYGIQAASNNIIYKNTILNTSSFGIYLPHDYAGVNITNNTLINTTGIFITGDNHTIINNTIWNTTGAGINITSKNSLVDANKIVNATFYGINVRSASSGLNITNNNLTNTRGILIAGANHSLLNNTVWNSTQHGIYLSSSTNTTIINNTVCYTANISIFKSPTSTHYPNGSLDMLNNNTFCNSSINRFELYWKYTVYVTDSVSNSLSSVVVDIYESNVTSIWKTGTTGSNGRFSLVDETGNLARQFYINGSGGQVNTTPHTINARHVSTGITGSTTANIVSNNMETTISLNLISAPVTSSGGDSGGTGGGGGGGSGGSLGVINVSGEGSITVSMPTEQSKEGPIVEKPFVFDLGVFGLTTSYDVSLLETFSVTREKEKIILFLNKDKFIYYKDGKGEFKFNLNWEPNSKLVEVHYIDILLYIIIILGILILLTGRLLIYDYLKRNRKI